MRRLTPVAVILGMAFTPSVAEAKPWVFVLAGQSNMAGRGLPVPPEQPDARIMEFTHHAKLTVARDPLNHEQGVGPGVSFARALLKDHPGRRIVLVQCAKGSTYLKQWMRGQYLFERCARLARQASRHGTLKGVLFAQGESDALSKPSARVWAARYRQFVRDFRSGADAPGLPFVHTILARTTQPRRFHEWRVVKSQQAAVRVPGDTAIWTGDLPLQDNVHFTVDGYRTMGERLASAWQEIPPTRLTKSDARKQGLRFVAPIVDLLDTSRTVKTKMVPADQCQRVDPMTVTCQFSAYLAAERRTVRGALRVHLQRDGLYGFLLPWDPAEECVGCR